jgi:uncharacterized protein Yka (UPF0111/DUF47 family)
MSRLATRLAGALGAREDEVFVLAAHAMANAVQVTDDLEGLVHFFPADDEYAGDLERDVREGERLDRDLLVRVSRTFVTPIDGDDLLVLSRNVAAASEAAGDFGELLQVYGVEAIRDPSRRLTQLLAGCARELESATAKALRRLPLIEDVAGHLIRIAALVAEGRHEVRSGLASLFAEQPDPIELVRWKDLFERLDQAFAAWSRAVAALEVIVAKRA